MIKQRKLLLFLSAILIYNLLIYILYRIEAGYEGANITNLGDTYWYSLVTLTTVGYGDFFPVTFWGRFTAMIFILGSLGMLGYMLTELSLKISEYIKKREMGHFGTTMKNHCIIIGWNDFSEQVAEQIIKADESLAVVVDSEDDLKSIKLLYPDKNCFVILSKLNDFENLNKVNITEAKRVYISFESDTDTLVYTISLKEKYDLVKCVVAIENVELRASFNYLGIQFIIPKKEIVSKFIASYIFEPNVALLTEDLISTSNTEENLDICENILAQEHELIGTCYFDAFVKLKKEHGIILIAVSRNSTLIKSPKDDFELEENDVLIYIANGKNKHAIFVD